MVAALRASGATVLMLTYPDVGELMAVARRVSPRLLAFNDEVRAIAARNDARLIDIERGGTTDARLFHPDRLHANAAGHERIALAAAEALELPGAERRVAGPAAAGARGVTPAPRCATTRAGRAPISRPGSAGACAGSRPGTACCPSARSSPRSTRRLRRSAACLPQRRIASTTSSSSARAASSAG